MFIPPLALPLTKKSKIYKAIASRVNSVIGLGTSKAYSGVSRIFSSVSTKVKFKNGV